MISRKAPPVQAGWHPPHKKKEILDDLKASLHAEGMIRLLEADEVIQKWMTLNKVQERQLKPA